MSIRIPEPIEVIVIDDSPTVETFVEASSDKSKSSRAGPSYDMQARIALAEKQPWARAAREAKNEPKYAYS